MSKHLAPDDLLAHTGWMATLARSLVLDQSEAEDVVQQTFVEVAEREPVRPRSLTAWLRGVVRNHALKGHRSEARRRRRERAVARPERVQSTPADLVERAELHRLVVDRVLALPEPYREAILLRYFDDLSAAEVAVRQAVPLATARTRLQRGLERLREELDRRHGSDRGQWLRAMLPIAGLAAAGSMTSATASAATSAAQIGLQEMAIGGILMTKSTAITVALLTATTLVLGGAIGRLTARMSREQAKTQFQLVDESHAADLESRLAAAEAQLKSEKQARAQLADEKADLSARVSSLDGELKAEREKAVAEAAPAPKKLPLAFGKYADLEGLTNADWPEMGSAVKVMNGLLAELMESLEKGEPISSELQKKITEENTKLVKMAVGIMGKIPTHSPVNGEFTHPLVLANLLGSLLDASDVPLSKAQLAAIARASSGYDTEYERLQDGYSKETTELEKFVDELGLKQEHSKRFREMLTPEQTAAAFSPQLMDRMQLDVLSPGVATVLSTEIQSYASAEEARNKFQQKLIKALGIDSSLSDSLNEHFDAWQRDVEPILSPDGKTPGPPRLDDALIAARAEVNLLKKLLANPNLDEKTRTTILGIRAWIVPQIKAKQQ